MKKVTPSLKNDKEPAFLSSGFTLIELLIVIVILTALALAVFVALNPVKRLQDARNARRITDTESIRTAINEYMVDKGSLPQGLTAGMLELQLGTSNGSGTSSNPSCAMTTGGCFVTSSACVDLSVPLAPYLKTIPLDPKSATAVATQYSVSVDTHNLITVNACGVEGGQKASVGKNLYGFASGYPLITLSPSELAQQLNAYQALGARWVRFDFPWNVIQSTSPTSYDWSKIDPVVNAAVSRGIKVVGVLGKTPSWEYPPGCSSGLCPPNSAPDFATFAAAAVSRYAPLGVHYWEIYNEPNSGYFSPAIYTGVLKAAYPVMKQADPAAFILAGGSEPQSTGSSGYAGTYSPIDFLTGMYQNGAKGYFDALAHHPYCYDAINAGYTCPLTTVQSWSAWSQMQDTNPSLRSVMVANGDGSKQIWATEFGAPTGGDSTAVTETQQAQMVSDAYKLFSSYSWSGPMLWYTYHDPCTTTTDRECYFGLVRYDYSNKPAYATYQSLASN